MSKYYIVRTFSNVEYYVHKGVSAIGWSSIPFAYETMESATEKIKDIYMEENCKAQLIGRKIGEIRRFMSIESGDVILVPTYKGFYMGVSTGKRIYDEKSKERDLANQIEIEYIKNNNEPVLFKRDNKLTALSTKLGVRGFTILSILENSIIREIETLRSAGQDIAYEEQVGTMENEKEREFVKKLSIALSDYNNTSFAAKGMGFEQLLVEMFRAYGYTTLQLNKRFGGSDVADADVLAVKESLLGEEFTQALLIQAKHYTGSSNGGIDQILGMKEKYTREAEEKGMIRVENYTFSSNQISYLLISSGDFPQELKDKSYDEGIICINGERLAEMLYQVIDDMPTTRKKLGFIRKYEKYEELLDS